MTEISYPSRIRVLAVQSGGLFGPLAGGLVSPILEPIATSFNSSTSAAAASLTAYFIPFACVLTVSGTLGERWGRRRVTQAAYALFVLGLVLAAAAPRLEWFLVGRGLQGLANSFTTPLLLAGLSEMVPRHRRSGAIGVFASFQAAGQSLAAIVAGTAETVSWRLAFAAVAAVAVLAALVPPPGPPRHGAAAPKLRSLVTVPIVLLCGAGFLTFAGAAGIAFMVALHAQHEMGMDIAGSSLLLTGFGLPGLLLGRIFGGLVGVVGAARCGRVATIAAGLVVAGVGFAGSVAVLATLWVCAGAFASLFNVSLQNLTLDASPENLGGGTSVVAALRFAGSAVAPVLWLPVFLASPRAAFVAAGATTCLAALAITLAGRRITADRRSGRIDLLEPP